MPGFISKVAMVPEKNIGVVILNNGFDVYGNDALFYPKIPLLIQH